MDRRTKQPQMQKIRKRSSSSPLIDADELIDFHFLMKELNGSQIFRMLELQEIA